MPYGYVIDMPYGYYLRTSRNVCLMILKIAVSPDEC